MADEEIDPNIVAGAWFWWTIGGAVLFIAAAFGIILFGGS